MADHPIPNSKQRDTELRRLVLRARQSGRPPTRRPRTIMWVVRRCRVSRTHLYDLMAGKRRPSEAVVHLLAAGLSQPVDVVARACGVEACA